MDKSPWMDSDDWAGSLWSVVLEAYELQQHGVAMTGAAILPRPHLIVTYIHHDAMHAGS